MRKKCLPCGTPAQPYYEETKNNLTQDHASIFRDTQFAAGIQIRKEFVVPAIDTDVLVYANHLVNVVVGSYVWNPAYGYLKIVHWDSCKEIIGLLNDGIDGAAIPGTVVSDGTLFVIAAKPCCTDQDVFTVFPFLAEDYVVPAVNASVNLTVTSTYGLVEGTLVRIGSNVYLLEQINSSLQILVKNQGAGGTPGTLIEARDANGELQYLITQAIESICTDSTTEPLVKLIGCNGTNQAILDGNIAGQVPVLLFPDSNEVAFQTLDTTYRSCTVLTSAFNILSTTPSYTIEVENGDVFDIGDEVNIGNDLLWEITDNTTSGELDITCTTGNPGITVTMPINTPVCVPLTTDELQDEIDNLQIQLDTGWTLLSATGTYISASAFSVAGDFTPYLKNGQKLKLKLAGVDCYANIESFGFGAGITTIEIIENLDYVLTNVAITNVEISLVNPPDFPAYFTYDCNPSGFSSITYELAVYWVIDSMVTGHAYVSGESDSPTFVVETPTYIDSTEVISPPSFYPTNASIASGLGDSGSAVAEFGNVFSSGFELVIYSGPLTSDNWASSGEKSAFVPFRYIIKQ